MNYRFADGGDKIAAFERGMSDEDANAAFETPDYIAVVVEEQFLVYYRVQGPALEASAYLRLYAGDATKADVTAWLREEAKLFHCHYLTGPDV